MTNPESQTAFESWSDEEKWQFLTRHEKLGEILVKYSPLTLEQLEELLHEQEKSGMHIGELIVNRGILSVDEILHALNMQRLNDKVSLESIIELQNKQKEST